MSRKARGSDALTGGTHDVNPQMLSNILSMSAADTFTEISFPIPIQRVSPNRPDEAILMELLKVVVEMPDLAAADFATVGATVDTAIFTLTTVTQGTVQFSTGNPRTIMSAIRHYNHAFTAAGSYYGLTEEPRTFDLTDGAGHGVLIATDNVFGGLETAGFGAAAQVAFKLLYRWKRVGLTEYIGIVQSQQ